ncbi:uncharacterized protein LOC129585705 isoform X1 [Paramacrobiotus metropolitanus]|uniref:uncharacterized protein LOC129585705 isoform X1 n=1 Tax=Paramacrobiotus metropolitanus TaxID=2943436 RepID=UPI002445C871|nr:uncharacterized protein LOC129585705 isoform X1 [Paramacrobiotus metropolitanus]
MINNSDDANEKNIKFYLYAMVGMFKIRMEKRKEADGNDDYGGYITQQQFWMRPLVMQAFRIASQDGTDNWKLSLYENFQKSLKATCLSGSKVTVGVTGSQNHPTISLQWTTKLRSDAPLRNLGITARILPCSFSNGFSMAESRVLISKCYRLMIRFLRAYDLYDPESKLNPFDQGAWDKMIWQYWTYIQFSTAKEQTNSACFDSIYTNASLPPVPLFFSNDTVLISSFQNGNHESEDSIPGPNRNVARDLIMKYFVRNPPVLKSVLDKNSADREKNYFKELHKARMQPGLHSQSLHEICVKDTGLPDLYACIRERVTASCLQQTEQRLHEINTQTFKLKQRGCDNYPHSNEKTNNTQSSAPAVHAKPKSAPLLAQTNPLSTNSAVSVQKTPAAKSIIENETKQATDENYSESAQEDMDPELDEDFGTESSDPKSFPWNTKTARVANAKTGTAAKGKKSVVTQQLDKASQKENTKQTPVKSPNIVLTPVPTPALATRKEALQVEERCHDTLSGFSMLNFLSMALLHAAAGMSQLDVYKNAASFDSLCSRSVRFGGEFVIAGYIRYASGKHVL